MDPQAQIIAGLVVGYVMQWGRSLKNIPDPVVYAAAGVLGGVIFFLASPESVKFNHRQDWFAVIAFLFTIRGVAGAAADAKLAPKSNTL